MIRTAWTIVSVVCAAALCVPQAHAQTTDCTRTRNPIDREICSNPVLEGLEVSLEKAFAGALARDPGRAATVQQSQKTWVAERYRVCSAGNISGCLERLARERLAAFGDGSELPAKLPEPEAVLSCNVIPRSGASEVFLQVRRPGRFSIRVESRVGIALQIVDMITGPGERTGEPGMADGRLDLLLDTGTYKLRTFAPAERADSRTPGQKASPSCIADPQNSDGPKLSVLPFRETAEPISLLADDGRISADLADLQQRSYWVAVPKDGTVLIEAVGRSLQDLRLWRNGTHLAPLAPTMSLVEPHPGHPLARARLRGHLEPGMYLVTAYGGPAVRWTDEVTGQPFHIRNGVVATVAGTQVEGVIGPFGSERFEAPSSATWYRLDLPEVAPVHLSVLENEAIQANARIEKNGREPVAIVTLPNAAQTRRIIEVSGTEGQRFRLGALKPQIVLRAEGAGLHDVSAEVLGGGGDEVPATLLFARFDRTGAGQVLASSAPALSSASAWRSRFNLRGRTSLFFEAVEQMQVAVRMSGQAVTASIEPALEAQQIPRADGQTPGVWNVEPGWYRLDLAPASEEGGMLDLSLGPPGLVEQAAVAANPVRTFVSLGQHAFDKDMNYLLVGNIAPRMAIAASIRALPADLSQAPYVAMQKAGESVEASVRLPERSVVRAFEPGGAPIQVEELSSAPAEDGIRTPRVSIRSGDRDRMVILTATDMSTRPLTPSLDRPETSESLDIGHSRFLDLAEGAKRSFSFEVAEGGLYRIETQGRLKTAATVSTAFLPQLDSATANGAGQNALVQTFLRAGRYRVEVSALESSGRLEVAAVAARLAEGGLLTPGGSVRASLTGGRGVVFPFVVPTAGPYRLDLLGLDKRVFTARIEDAEGWPLAPPGPLDSLTEQFEPGRYRLVVMPQSADARVVARLTPISETAPPEGHGPHAVTFDTVLNHQWREPPGRDERRIPDSWTFTLHGPSEITSAIGDGMVATLFEVEPRRQIARFVHKSDFSGRLPAGRYVIEAESLGRNDRLDYDLTVRSQEIQPGVARRLKIPSTVPFAIAEDRVVTLRTFGRVDLHAVLRDDEGRVVERLDDRVDDWNIALSRPLPAGRYHLRLSAVLPGGNDESEPTEVADDDAEAVELLLSLPESESTVRPQLPRRLTVSGTGVHRQPVPAYEAGSLILATADSSAELVLALERLGHDGRWSTIGLERGRKARVAAPADGDEPRPFRVAVWSVDGSAEPISFAVRAIRQLPQASTRPVVLQPVTVDPGEGAGSSDPPAARVALVAVPGAMALTLKTPTSSLLQGSAPGRPLVAPSGPILTPQTERLWLVVDGKGPETVTFAPVAPVAGGLALAAPPDGTATLGAVPIPENGVRFWRAESAFGTPGLDAGRGMGVAAGSALALAAVDAPFRLTNAKNGDLLRARVFLHDAELLPNKVREATFSEVLQPGTAQPLRLPPGGKRLNISLPAGTVAVAGWTTPDAVTAWTGSAPLSRTIEGGWTDLLFANLGERPAPVSVAFAPLPGEPARLTAGMVFKRFFGAAGTFDLPIEGAPGDRLMAAGATLSFLGEDGRISEGTSIPIASSGLATLTHGPGLSAVWIERPGIAAWPTGRPTEAVFPSIVDMKDAALSLTFEPRSAILLCARTTAPVILSISANGEGHAEPVLFPAGALFQRYVDAGRAELRVNSPHDGSLAGTLELAALPIGEVSEGIGSPRAAAPGTTVLFGFEVKRKGPVGVGIRAEPDRAVVRLLDDSGKSLGDGMAQLHQLDPGRYVLEVRIPADSQTTTVRPAVVGIAPPTLGTPPEVAAKYLELVGMTPTRPRRESTP